MSESTYDRDLATRIDAEDWAERHSIYAGNLAQAQLAVVLAAKAQRRLDLAIDNVKRTGPQFDDAINAWSASCRVLAAAVDALLELEADQS